MHKRQNIIEILLKRDGSICRYCGKEFSELAPPSIDHIVPISGGGSDDISNYQLLHWICNSRKGGNKTLGNCTSNQQKYLIITRTSRDLPNTLEYYKYKILNEGLREFKQLKKTSKYLKINRITIYKMLKKYNLPRNACEWDVMQEIIPEETNN